MLRCCFTPYAVFLSLLFFAPGAFGQSPVPDDATVERIAQGFQFVEGPAWQNGGLFFSDIPGNTIYRWTPEDGAAVYHRPSSNSNGLALDAQGRLLLAQHGARRIARLEADGTETTLAATYEGARLNSPNDLALHPDGSIYFTDPPWGISPGQAELDFTGVFRIAPDGALHLLVDSLFYPNGIAFSPDFTTLYVSTSHARTVVSYGVEDHVLSNGRIFATLAGNGGEAADGMVIDPEGHLYVAGPGGIWIFAPGGALLDRIDVPGQTTNVTLGDADRRTLYITSGSNLYRIRLVSDERGTNSQSPEPSDGHADLLHRPFPNPTSGPTTITYTLTAPAMVEITLVDALGRTLRVLDAGPQSTGWHTITANLADLPAATYFIRLKAGERVVTRPLIVQR